MFKPLCLGSFCFISLDYTQTNPDKHVPQKYDLSLSLYTIPRSSSITLILVHTSFQDIFGSNILVS